MGRKKIYEHTKVYEAGAPRLVTRVAPDVLEWIESRPEGTRPYIERVVRADREATANGAEKGTVPGDAGRPAEA